MCYISTLEILISSFQNRQSYWELMFLYLVIHFESWKQYGKKQHTCFNHFKAWIVEPPLQPLFWKEQSRTCCTLSSINCEPPIAWTDCTAPTTLNAQQLPHCKSEITVIIKKNRKERLKKHPGLEQKCECSHSSSTQRQISSLFICLHWFLLTGVFPFFTISLF